MPITLTVSVPNIGSLVPTYNAIRVFRSSVSQDGPFTELTGSGSVNAILLGTTSGPFIDLNGKTLILRTKNQQGTNPDVAVTFSDANPITAAQVATAIQASGAAVTAVDAGGFVQITSTATGQQAVVQVMGGSGLADLGFVLYGSAAGQDPFIALVANQTQYLIQDPTGSNTYWYRWQFYHTGTFASSALTAPVHPGAAQVDSNRTVQDFRSSKGLTLVRGREHTFRMAFWQDEAANIPLLPDSSGQYPVYTIFDINGELITSGRGDVDGSAPNYKATFLTPQDAILSTDDRRWRIEWFFRTDTGREVSTIDNFDVRDVDVTETESRDQRYLAMENMPFRLHLRLPKEAYSISMTVTESDDPTIVVVPVTTLLTKVQDGETIVYEYDIPGNTLQSGTMGKSYQAVWSLQMSPSSGVDYTFQIIDVPPTKIARFFASLRQQIDKVQKRKGTAQAYENSDLFEYMRQGLNYINGVHPANLNFTLVNIPPMMEPYWLMASMMWGLRAQQITEIDLSFGFSGQQISLDYDRSSALETAIAGAVQLIESGAKAIKEHLYRNNSAIGSYTGRSPRLAGNTTYVYPISSGGGSQNYLTLLNKVGLLVVPFMMVLSQYSA